MSENQRPRFMPGGGVDEADDKDQGRGEPVGVDQRQWEDEATHRAGVPWLGISGADPR